MGFCRRSFSSAEVIKDIVNGVRRRCTNISVLEIIIKSQ